MINFQFDRTPQREHVLVKDYTEKMWSKLIMQEMTTEKKSEEVI